MKNGNDLKKWRESRAMSQSMLAAHLDVARPTIAIWERPKTQLSKILVLALVALDIDTKKTDGFLGVRTTRKETERVRSEPLRKRRPRKSITDVDIPEK